jgi:hypothetical protein
MPPEIVIARPPANLKFRGSVAIGRKPSTFILKRSETIDERANIP